MITVKFRGQTGNQLTQYAFGRLLAHKMAHTFKCQRIDAFPELSTDVHGVLGGEVGFPTGTISVHQDSAHKRVLEFETLSALNGFNIELEGYWERAEYYVPDRYMVRSWFMKYYPKHPVAVHVRGGDGKHNAPPVQYYRKALEGLGYPSFDIYTDDTSDDVVYELGQLGGTILAPRDARTDFDNLASYDTIIASNSTFSWWAAFLSSARRVIQPEPLEGFRSKQMPNSSLLVPHWEQIQY